MPLVTVIIPTYGQPQFLSKSIDSVLAQTHHDIQLIVVDDNNPGTPERAATEVLMEQYDDPRVLYLRHDRNRNGAVARNTGLAQARGQYVAFLDSDDEYMPDRIQRCLEVLEQAPANVAGVYTGCEFRRGGRTFDKFTDVHSGNFLCETLACKFNFCTGSNIFVRRGVIDELKGFDESFLRHQDYEFLVRLFDKYSLEAIPEILVIKNNENFNLPNIKKIIDIKKQYLAKFRPQIDALDSKERKYVFHANYVSVAELALRKKDFRNAFRFYRKAFKHKNFSLREVALMLALPVITLFH